MLIDEIGASAALQGALQVLQEDGDQRPALREVEDLLENLASITERLEIVSCDMRVQIGEDGTMPDEVRQKVAKALQDLEAEIMSS